MGPCKMTEMGDVLHVIRMEVTRDIEACWLIVTQKDYTMRRLVKYGMHDCRPLGTPGCNKERFLMKPEECFLDEEAKRRFRAIVGSILCSSQVTCNDVSYAFNKPPKAMSKSSKVAKHLLRYLAGRMDLGFSSK